MKYVTLFVLFCYFNIYSQTQNTGWSKNIEIINDGIARYFDVFVSKNWKKKSELVIQLHGGTQSKDKLYDDNGGGSKYWKDLAEKENFLLIVPNGTNSETGKTTGDKLNWNDCRVHPNDNNADDVGFISKIIDWSIANYSINAKKVYITGVSNGGLMSYRLALEIPQKITAIAAFNANFYKESECKNTNIPIPVMIVNGTKDKFMPFDGGKTKFRNEDALSSKETVNFWIKNNHLDDRNVVVTSVFDTNKDDKSTIQSFFYKDSNDNNAVLYCIVNGAGHTMPGKKYVLSRFIQRLVGRQNQDIEGAEMAWEFFKGISK
jgi:polyhydroxybutyrate depolymerase